MPAWEAILYSCSFDFAHQSEENKAILTFESDHLWPLGRIGLMLCNDSKPEVWAAVPRRQQKYSRSSHQRRAKTETFSPVSIWSGDPPLLSSSLVFRRLLWMLSAASVRLCSFLFRKICRNCLNPAGALNVAQVSTAKQLDNNSRCPWTKTRFWIWRTKLCFQFCLLYRDNRLEGDAHNTHPHTSPIFSLYGNL